MQYNKTNIFIAKYSISFLLPEKTTRVYLQEDNKTNISIGYNLLIYSYIIALYSMGIQYTEQL